MTKLTIARSFALAAAALVLPSLAGCGIFQYLNRCDDHSNCPVPEQCLSGYCMNPEWENSGFTSCSSDDDCPLGACYEGYCEIPSTAGGGTGDSCSWHSECETDGYCGINGKCVAPDPDVTVLRGTGTDDEVTLVAAEDVSLLDGVDVIAGSLYIGQDYAEQEQGALAVDELVLPDLQVVTGSIQVVRQRQLQVLRFPSLERVGGNVSFGTGWDDEVNDIRVIDMPSLVQVGTGGQTDSSSFSIDGNRLLSEVNLPALESVYTFDLTAGEPEGNGDELPDPLILDLSSLTSTENVTISGNDAPIGEITFSPPAEIGALWIDSMDYDVAPLLQTIAEATYRMNIRYITGTPAISLSALTSVYEELEITQTTATTIEAPLLTSVGELNITSNDELVELSLPELTTAPDLSISGNALLDVCEAVEIKDQVNLASADADISGNNGDPADCQ